MINISQYKSRTDALFQKALSILKEIDLEAYKSLGSVYDVDEPKLQLALVGQYNAGKSTIMKALTGDQSIKVDSNICTNEVTAYDWNDIRILDTPGIHAGRYDHDEVTYQAIDQADLLIFAITNELFDDVIGKHFQQLAFERQKAKEILLVVNKMSRDPGTPEIKIPSLLPVLEPYLPQDFNTTFIDAEYYLDAQSEDDLDDKEELILESHFLDFEKAINQFVKDKGIMGRLTTPLSSMQTMVRKIYDAKSVSDPNEQILVELLHRKLAILRHSEMNLKNSMSDMLRSALFEIQSEGDNIAESLSETSSEEAIKEIIKTAQMNSEGVLNRLQDDFAELIEGHINKLEAELQQLEQSELAQLLSASLEKISMQDSQHFYKVGEDVFMPENDPERRARYQKLSGWAQKGFNFAAKSAEGTKAFSGKILSSTGASGSQIHNGVKFLGKLVGYKFAPWEAVNIAKNIGNFAKYAGPVISLIGVGLQIYDDVKQEEMRQSLNNARAEVRKDFRKIAHDLEKNYKYQINSICEDIFRAMTNDTQSILDDMTSSSVHKSSQREILLLLDKEIGSLISEIQDMS